MSDRQWPTTKIGTAWLTYDPEDGWSEHDNPNDAMIEFGAIVDHLRDESSDGWHESADTAAWGIWIPIERLRLTVTARAEDDTEEGERCRDEGWDALLDGAVERVEPDAHAEGFCTAKRAAVIAELRIQIAALEAERDALRADLDKAHATIVSIVSIAVACATIDCEDLVAKHTTPDDYDDLVGHVERVVEEGHELRAEVAKARALLTECVAEVEARGVDPSLAAAVRAWLGVGDG